MIIPKKLQHGDEIRIIAPSRSANILSEIGIEQAKTMLEEIGLVVTFGEHVFESDLHNSASIEHRLDDLHNAFQDQNVKGILTAIGGFNSNELLPFLDYESIRQNPKIFCGYSDITALASAITSKTGLITYSGPHFSSFHMEELQNYQIEYFKNCLMQSHSYEIQPSLEWSDDAWFLDQENRKLEATNWKIYNEGQTSGQLFGGNLCTLNLLQGTSYMPNLENAILFLEDDEMTIPETFARDLTSLLQSAGKIKGLVIGRFQRESKMTEDHILYLFDKLPLLKSIPVLYDVDFGHTQPIFTFPIGGRVELNSSEKQIKIVQF
ncbi:LD-carboxypeptidase [Planococcus sp. N028]|uniref:LD-carboxypeptidase n=1 Tax=Planococcus shixiaomingii TaxID=3058393 RepID=A0ABT8MZC6_9BACL|nr:MULTISPECIES: S66 peptidase family protein [unclassified Planococcus (in: firmicutes)]MDN7240960.1 LD-carboxypeptidase [Planococcus sp. N028]WKA53213.1 LD-carboxypeptidase [Planococcus sp. N022]